MMKFYRMLDEFFIAQTRRAYLWLYDWTGVYVGTVLFILTIAFVGVTGSTALVDFLVIFVNGVCGCLLHHEQHNRPDDFNAGAEQRIKWTGRHLLNLFVLGIIIVAVVSLDLGWTMMAAVWLTINYTMTIKIRKREPKEFFEGRLAHEC